MKKKYATPLILLLFTLVLSGCRPIGDKSASFSVIYGAAAVLSLFLLIGCCLIVHQKKLWFVMLFSSVLIVNIGYTFLSMSTCLAMALWANRLAYLGSVFLPLAMLMILLNVSETKYSVWLPRILVTLSLFMFLIAASPGILNLYYKEVSFAVIHGVSTLVKVYGPLHPLYLFYLLGYFIAMVAVIIRGHSKGTIHSTAHSVILTIAVFVNIGVWLIEQLASIDFEMLSISYIISELFLLGVHLVVNEYQKLQNIVRQVETVQSNPSTETVTPNVMLEKPLESNGIAPERMDAFLFGLNQLTPTEKAVFEAHIARVTTKEIMANLNIKESTLKYHNRNLYGKLGVSSRKELLEVYKHLKAVKEQLEQ